MLLGSTGSAEDAKKALIRFIKNLYKSKAPVSEMMSPAIKKEPVRIYIDGGFDLIHSGHYNAIR
jgi:hypothetical protein